MYAFGWEVPKDDKEAIYWFERAAFHAENGVDPLPLRSWK